MKLNLLKTLLVAAGLLTGTSGAWAEDEALTLTPTGSTVIQADGTSAQNADVVLYGQTLHCSQAQISGNAFKNMLAAYEGTPVVITQFDASSALEGKTLVSATLKFHSVCTVAGKNSNVQVALIGTDWDATTATWNNTNTATIMNAVAIHDGGDGKGGTNINTAGGDVEVDVKEYLDADDDKKIGFGIYTYTGRDQAITNITLVITAVEASSTTTYTVEYKDGEGNTLKDAVSYPVAIGTSVTASDVDMASFLNADGTQKYVYVSGNETITADGTAANNVITLVFRAVDKVTSATVNYTYNGTTISTENVVLTNAFDGDSYTLPFRYIIVDGNTVYKTANNSDTYYGDNVTISKDLSVNKELTVLYENVDVVLFEDFDSDTDKNAGVRASYCSSYNNQTYESSNEIAAGKYTILMRAANVGRGSTLTIGDEDIFSVESIDKNSWNNLVSTDIVIAGGVLRWNKGAGGAADPIDILLVVRNEVPVTVSQYGYATLCPSVGLDFTGTGIDAYIATEVSGSSVKLEQVNTVAAEEGVLLVAEGGKTVNVPVAADAVASKTNLFVGVTETIEALASTVGNVTNFILNVGEDIEAGFYLANGKKVAAGKAYLPVANYNAESTAKGLTLVFGNEATGISEVSAQKAAADNAYYTLSGVRVQKPTKGLYIVNGKKVVIR